jgi:hypothetical protein
MDAHVILLTEAYRAFNARETESVLALMQPDVDWPNLMENCRAVGHDAVRDYWTRQWAIFDPHVALLRFKTDDEGRVAIDVHQVVRDLNGALLADQIVQHVYTLRDGLIARMEVGSAPSDPFRGAVAEVGAVPANSANWLAVKFDGGIGCGAAFPTSIVSIPQKSHSGPPGTAILAI